MEGIAQLYKYLLWYLFIVIIVTLLAVTVSPTFYIICRGKD
jgi:hypothetical protein